MSEREQATRPGVRIGLDVGTVRLGIASSDPHGMLATPVRTIKRTASRDGVAEVARIVAEADAIEVVVGLPRSLSGDEGPAAHDARAYAVRVADAVVPIPVRLVDERLSTVSAHQQLHEAGRAGRKHRQVVDQVAAVLILQSALDTESRTGRVPGETVRVRADSAGTKESGT